MNEEEIKDEEGDLLETRLLEFARMEIVKASSRLFQEMERTVMIEMQNRRNMLPK